MTCNDRSHHAEITSEKFRTDGMERIRLNVGGQKHETYLSTVGNLPDTRLFSIIESAVKSPDYDPETTEVFFDRHPAVFAQVLNYYRTGKLHCPTDVCGPLFEAELMYWGIDEKDMEPCCWATYTQHRDAEENLKNILYESASEEVVPDTSIEQPKLSSLWKKVQPHVWCTLDQSRSSRRARIFSMISVMFIVASVLMFCVNTIPELAGNKRWQKFFNILETVCGIFFTIEFLLRMIFCPNKRAFASNWSTWIDFLAISPFYLNFIVGSDTFPINALLVIRLLRLFRFFRLIYGLQVLLHTLKASSYELVLLLFMLLIPVILFSSVVYFTEFYNDSKNTKFRSIPHSFWWSLITITTVGYGDMHPVTPLGKIVGSICAICGVLIVALPVSIIGSNFSLYYTHAQARLKLPKKKNRLFIQQTSTIYSERQMPRRRTVRRKPSSRVSEASLMYEDCRTSSAQGYSIVKGTKRCSNPQDEGKAQSSNRRSPKKISSISVRIPALESPGEDYSYNAPVAAGRRGYSSFDSTHYVTRQSRTNPSGGLRRQHTSEVHCVDGETMECLRNKKNDNNRKCNYSQSYPEMIPLLVETSASYVKPRERDTGVTAELEESRQLSDQHQFSEEKKENLAVLVTGESDSGHNTRGDVQNSMEGDASMKRVPQRCKDVGVNWKRRPSSLGSISEAMGAREIRSVKDSGVDIVDENIAPKLQSQVPAVNFNRERRQPVF